MFQDGNVSNRTREGIDMAYSIQNSVILFRKNHLSIQKIWGNNKYQSSNISYR